MKMRWLPIFLCVLLLSLISCDSGGGSGGVVKASYTAEDLEGTWNWRMDDGAGTVVTGTITLGGGLILAITNSTCTHIADGWMKVLTDTYVKGRNMAWCTDTTGLMKFSLFFESTNRIAGLMDYHPNPPDGGYKRYEWVMTR